jgi:class 3 adenylate cyclase
LPLSGERKQVTVLFCDLVGSVAIAERLDPEDYHDVLEDYLDLVFPEIYKREGVVNVLAGDGLMALFGAPVAHEDAPERAVKAALAIREALEPLSTRLQAQHGVPLQVRIGINTGPVVVGQSATTARWTSRPSATPRTWRRACRRRPHPARS